MTFLLWLKPEVEKFDKENFSWLKNSRRKSVTVATQVVWTVVCVCVRERECGGVWMVQYLEWECRCESVCETPCVRAQKHFLSEQHWYQNKKLLSSLSSHKTNVQTLILKVTPESVVSAPSVSFYTWFIKVLFITRQVSSDISSQSARKTSLFFYTAVFIIRH